MGTPAAKQDSIALIRDLTNAFGPSAFEDEVVAVAERYTNGIFNTRVDHLLNFYLDQKGADSSKPTLLLDAHSDEVGLMIQNIRPNGTLGFVPLGSWNPNTLPSSKVLVRNAEGKLLRGVVASGAVHFFGRTEYDKPIDISELTIDIGATSAEEAREVYGVRIGEPALPDVAFEYDEEHDIMTAKAFDCRIGCAALIETMRRLDGEALGVNPRGVLSAQEELGERGISVAVHKINPEIAICFEGCPADDTIMEPYAVQTALKKGPMLRFMDKSIICSPKYMRWALDLAQRHGIPVQTAVRTGGGNNGGVINLTGDGVPTIVIGIPVRYAHSHYTIASYQDFEHAVELAVLLAKNMDAGVIARL